MKLTPLGKVVLFGVGLFFLGVIYVMFFQSSPQKGPQYAWPAQLPFSSKQLPLTGDTRSKFADKAVRVTDPCGLFDQTNGGIPLSFDAFIPSSPRSSPYYYEDPKTGEQYLPAYYIAPNGDGLTKAQAWSENTFDSLPDCLDGSGTGSPPDGSGVILLGFPKGTTPATPYVHVYGALWYDSQSLNPDQTANAAGKDTRDAPVIKVAAYKTLSASQAADPANQSFPINVAVGQGPGIIRVERVEFADDQTRVWIQLINLSPKPLTGWSGADAACIRPIGSSCLPTTGGQDTTSDGTDSNGNAETPSDVLQSTVSIPPAVSGGSLEGYLTFEKLDPNQALQLELPDFTADISQSDVTPPIIIRLPNAKTAQADK